MAMQKYGQKLVIGPTSNPREEDEGAISGLASAGATWRGTNSGQRWINGGWFNAGGVTAPWISALCQEIAVGSRKSD
jgi:hypothetical protein